MALRTGPSVRARAKAICPHDKALCSWVCTIVLSSFEISGLIFSPFFKKNSSSLNFAPKQHLEFLECIAASSPEGSSSSSSSPQQKHYFAHKSSEKKRKNRQFESSDANVQLREEFNFVNRKMSLSPGTTTGLFFPHHLNMT